MLHSVACRAANQVLQRFYNNREGPYLDIRNKPPISYQLSISVPILRLLNSLLPVSQYIDTTFADKGSHQKKNLQPKCPDTSKFGLLGKPTKKLELNPLF